MRNRRLLQLVTIAWFLVGLAVFALNSSSAAARLDIGSGEQHQNHANPCNPCAKKAQNPCNPCAKKAHNPCNPCAGKEASGEVYAPATSYAGWNKINSKPLMSETHGGVFVNTYLNPAAQAAVNSKAKNFPAGSIIIKESFSNESGKPGSKGTVFAMEKTDNGWMWLTTDSSGHVTGKGDSQKMQMCAQCHAGAKMDSAYLRKK